MSRAHDSASPQQQQHYSSFSGQSPTPVSAVGGQTPNTRLPNTADPKPKAKPVNVFSDDGSFLKRLQRGKVEEEETKKAKKDLERKMNFEDRFKNRGKRKLPPPEDENEQSSTNNSSPGTSNPGSGASTTRTTPEQPPLKRTRADEQADEYQKEMRNFENSTGSLSSNGTGSKLRVK